uniref:Uncharacterized protein n=1 Tax=Araneus ventricosus TaxID=182803 RepID=A0A4Y2F8J7_ARAVE|nr:hypothetical protein AVEN_224641-1 [Araneus ventricosus]
MTRTIPELAPLLQTSEPHQREDVWPLRMIWRATGPIPDGPRVESGLEPIALLPKSKTLTLWVGRWTRVVGITPAGG